MELQVGNAPDVSAEQKIAAELVKRIRKLRWIGMDDEAELVQVEIASLNIAAIEPVVAAPPETD